MRTIDPIYNIGDLMLLVTLQCTRSTADIMR